MTRKFNKKKLLVMPRVREIVNSQEVLLWLMDGLDEEYKTLDQELDELCRRANLLYGDMPPNYRLTVQQRGGAQ